MSDNLLATVNELGVDRRYSVVDDYIGFIAGKTSRRLIDDTSSMATAAAKKCLVQADIVPDQIGMLIAVTNTANRQLPCMAYEVMANLGRAKATSINVVNLQNQGCSALLKAIDLANQYLTLNPKKLVLIAVAESHTAYWEPKLKPKYFGFSELIGVSDENVMDTQKLLELFLFGDAGFALVMKASENGNGFHSFKHQTNIQYSDSELLRMEEGGALTPGYDGHPYFCMSKEVPRRSAHYAQTCLNDLICDEQSGLGDVHGADNYLIHTGSRKVLSTVCRTLKIPLEKAQLAYDVLRDYGNLSSCSIGFMLNNRKPGLANGKDVVIAFGAGFSATACVLEDKVHPGSS